MSVVVRSSESFRGTLTSFKIDLFYGLVYLCSYHCWLIHVTSSLLFYLSCGGLHRKITSLEISLEYKVINQNDVHLCRRSSPKLLREGKQQLESNTC